MTYIDDKHNKKAKKKDGKSITYKAPEKKNSILTIVLAIAVAIVAIIALIAAVSQDRKNSENGVSRQESAEISKADDDRKGILSQVANSLLSYQANNRGVNPSTQEKWNNFWTEYVGTPKDSTGASYKLAAACVYGEQNSNCVKPSSLTWKNNKQEIYIVTKATCSDSGTDIESSSGSRRFAVYTVLSNDKAVCVSN